MTARKIVQPFPNVTPEADGMGAALVSAQILLPGLIPCGGDGRPYTVLLETLP